MRTPGHFCLLKYKYSVNQRISLTLTFASTPPKLPKFMLLLLAWRLEGGRPPLGGGCGMGDGDVCGDETRGLATLFTAKEVVD